jgi:hypothetical protein
VVLRSGWVIVGSLPTRDGSAATAKAGCLLVLNSSGTVVETLSGGDINGWDMTALDMGSTVVLFVTNVLNGTVAASGTVTNGTVLRIVLSIPGGGGIPTEKSRTITGSGFHGRLLAAVVNVDFFSGVARKAKRDNRREACSGVCRRGLKVHQS